MLKIGDTVHIKKTNDIALIKEIYSTEGGNIYIIQVKDKSLIKILEEDIEAFEPKDPDTITITREDFKSAYMRALNPDKYEDMSDITYNILIVSGELIISELEKELFNND